MPSKLCSRNLPCLKLYPIIFVVLIATSVFCLRVLANGNFTDAPLKPGKYTIKLDLYYEGKHIANAENKLLVADNKISADGESLRPYVALGIGSLSIVTLMVVTIVIARKFVCPFFRYSDVKSIIEGENLDKSVKLIADVKPYMKTMHGFLSLFEDDTGIIYGFYHRQLKGRLMVKARVRMDNDQQKFLEVKEYNNIIHANIPTLKSSNELF